MNSMNVFQQLWKNWSDRTKISGWPASGEHLWINELNQAVFSRLEKILPSNVKVRAVTTPAFVYWTEAAGGYGVDYHAGLAQTHRILLPKNGSFEERVDAVVEQLDECIRGAATVFFYMPIVPMCEHDLDGQSPNRYMMSVRMLKTGETVDVGNQTADGNT